MAKQQATKHAIEAAATGTARPSPRIIAASKAALPRRPSELHAAPVSVTARQTSSLAESRASPREPRPHAATPSSAAQGHQRRSSFVATGKEPILSQSSARAMNAPISARRMSSTTKHESDRSPIEVVASARRGQFFDPGNGDMTLAEAFRESIRLGNATRLRWIGIQVAVIGGSLASALI